MLGMERAQLEEKAFFNCRRIMQTDRNLLITQIAKLMEEQNLSLRSIERRSGTHNLSSVMRPKDEDAMAPIPALWLKLHERYPQYISEPVYVSGGKVYKNVAQKVGETNFAGGDIKKTTHNVVLTPTARGFCKVA